MFQTPKAAALFALLLVQCQHSTSAASDEVCESPSAVQGTAMLSHKMKKMTTAKAAGAVEEDLTMKEYHVSQGMFKQEKVVPQPVPPAVHQQVVKLTQQGSARAEAPDPFTMHWLTASDLNPSWSSYPDNIWGGFDHNPATWGGAVSLVLDLADQYFVNKIRIDWRVCKCMLAGSHVIQASIDGINFVTIHSPMNLYVYGGHALKEYTQVFKARYIRILATAVSPLRYISWWELDIQGYLDPARPNVYGWYHSYKAGEKGLSGTEIMHLTSYKGQLFAGTGYWMDNTNVRTAEVVRLDCPYCDWVVEAQISQWAGRTELLKAIEWTNDANGAPISGGPMSKLIAGYYIDYVGEGRCYISVREDGMRQWYSQYYWSKAPFVAQHFSARAAELYQDPVTKVDILFASTGKDGIVAGVYDSSSVTLVKFATTTESGPVDARPLSITQHDGRLYFSAASKIYRRTNGVSPSWSVVIDMAEHDTSGTVDEAVGGIRGLTSIHNLGSPSNRAMLFTWVPNAVAAGCVIRLDVDQDNIAMTQEKCVKDAARDWLGPNNQGLEAVVTFTIADYNRNLEISYGTGGSEKVQLIGFQIMVYAYTAHEFPVDPSQTQTSASGKLLGFYAGAGYLLRYGPTNWAVREPLRPRYNPADVYPKLVAVRTLAESPFPTEPGAVYMGGYDCNHFKSFDTAWIVRGSPEAAYASPVKCQKELGCGHTPGDAFQTYGCNMCGTRPFNGLANAYFDAYKRPVPCQDVLNWLNSPAGAGQCPNYQTGMWARKCCTGCDMCLDTGKTFATSKVAGVNPDGSTYTCGEAKSYIDSGYTNCIQGMIWWQAVCCTA